MTFINKKRIQYKKERVILSDILPYEVPPFFSNRSFYTFLVSNKIHICGERLQFKKDPSGKLEFLVRLVFGVKRATSKKEGIEYDFFRMDKIREDTIPFNFKINHKENDFRALSVIHPINQLLVVEFYEKYKYTIINHSRLSRYSLRKPSKVASTKYYKGKSKSQEIRVIESSDQEYSNLRNFFSYKDYRNVYEFYESPQYQKAEKSFDNLLRFDIARCFDSIYTHTFPWAIFNKEIIKDNISKSKNTFGGRFDYLMQKMNYNETNGIVIGPEFSRIFAEIILQRIDKNVEKDLYKKRIRFWDDYVLFRYVDDYFLFYSKERLKDEVLNLFSFHLQKFNLFLNDSKTQVIPKPIITNITVAKEEIRKLVEFSMILRFYDQIGKNEIGLKYHSAKDVITNYKKILHQTGTSYKDLQNYFLAIIFNKTKGMIKVFQEAQKKLLDNYYEIKTLEEMMQEENSDVDLENKIEELKAEISDQEKIVKSYYDQLIKNFCEIIELTFFVYSVLPRVTYSIKVCHILFRIVDFIKNQERTKNRYRSKSNLFDDQELKYFAFPFDKKHIIFKNIYDGILTVFKKNNSSEYAEVETLYLLYIVNELGKHYYFSEDTLITHFNIKNEKGDLNFKANYFTVISLLNHIKRKGRYENIREYLLCIISKKFESFNFKKAEDIFLLIDILACPFVGDTDEEIKNYRKKILEEISFFDNRDSNEWREEILEEMSVQLPNAFFHWTGSSYGKVLNTKRGHDVY